MKNKFPILIITILLTAHCACAARDIPVDKDSAAAGGAITAKGEAAELYSGSLKIGDDFTALAEAAGIDFPFRHTVTIVSTVPSIDTPVCELQTHNLSAARGIAKGVDIITISRDLPMAQARFAKEGRIKNIAFVSDYKTGAFGQRSGLMIRGRELLARSLIVLDADGIVRYIQVVPELSHLPDIKAAVAAANLLAEEGSGK